MFYHFVELVLKGLSVQVRISAKVRISAQLKLSANLNKRKHFGDQFWKELWKEFYDFANFVTCLARHFIVFVFFVF